MNFSGIKYLTKQGLLSMVRNRMMSIASIGVLTACLLITGISVLVSMNVSSLIDYLGDQNKMIVYIDLDAEDTVSEQVGVSISEISNVASYDYISKAAALEQTKEWIGEYDSGSYSAVLDGYEGENNPLYNSYSVHVSDLELIDETSASISALPGVDFVESPSDLAGTIIGIEKTVTYAGIALVGSLGLVAILVISNTIRLTVFSRRKEINIMKFVGATNNFIRLPFWVEGTVLGLVSALLAFGLVSGAYIWVLQIIEVSGISWLQSIYFTIIPYNSIWAYLLAGFTIAGVLLGGFGSAVSIRKHLKV